MLRSIHFWACVLCALIITAAVDPTPDPPALNPDRQYARLYGNSSAMPVLPVIQPALNAAPPLAPARWVARRDVHECEHRVPEVARVHHATDTSPPLQPLL